LKKRFNYEIVSHCLNTTVDALLSFSCDLHNGQHSLLLYCFQFKLEFSIDHNTIHLAYIHCVSKKSSPYDFHDNNVK